MTKRTAKCKTCNAPATCGDGDGPQCRAHCGNPRCAEKVNTEDTTKAALDVIQKLIEDAGRCEHYPDNCSRTNECDEAAEHDAPCETHGEGCPPCECGCYETQTLTAAAWEALKELRKELACKHFRPDPEAPGEFLLCGHLEGTGLSELLEELRGENESLARREVGRAVCCGENEDELKAIDAFLNAHGGDAALPAGASRVDRFKAIIAGMHTLYEQSCEQRKVLEAEVDKLTAAVEKRDGYVDPAFHKEEVARLSHSLDEARMFSARVQRTEKEVRDELRMYVEAWRRELGPPYAAKTHHIDMLVVTTRQRMDELKKLREDTKQRAHECETLRRENETLRREIFRLNNIVCDQPACTAAIVRHDDGSRMCTAGHPARWVNIDALTKAEVDAAAFKATARFTTLGVQALLVEARDALQVIHAWSAETGETPWYEVDAETRRVIATIDTFLIKGKKG